MYRNTADIKGLFSHILTNLHKVVILPYLKAGGNDVEECAIPKCLKCNKGDLVPLSDYGGQGASVHYKAWVCTNPSCGFNLKIRNGDIYLNEPIMPGGMNVPRAR